jgi:hypothetical protein
MVRINDTATVQLRRTGNAAELLVSQPPFGLAIRIELRSLEVLAAELAEEAQRWRQACEPPYYRVLGLDRDASPEAIRAAYRRLSRKLHPDVSSENTGAAMRELNAAYAVLSDPKQREQYDLSATI